MVENATLHNEDEIARLDAREGDTVVIQRAGDVIPQVVRVIMERRPRGTKPYPFPHNAPPAAAMPCARSTRRTGKEDVDRRCTGGLICAAQAVERLRHFVSRLAFDIEGFGGIYIETLHEKGLLKEPADIFRLAKKPDALNKALAERRAELSAGAPGEGRQGRGQESKKDDDEDSKLVANLVAVHRRAAEDCDGPLHSTRSASATSGETNARLIARHYPNIDAFIEAMESETAVEGLREIGGIGRRGGRGDQGFLRRAAQSQARRQSAQRGRGRPARGAQDRGLAGCGPNRRPSPARSRR